MRSVQTQGLTPGGYVPRRLFQQSRLDSTLLGLSILAPVFHASDFLPPFAPPPLRGFKATMEALTPCAVSRRAGSHNLGLHPLRTIPPPTTLCSIATVFSTFPSLGNLNMLLPVLRQAFTPHEYGLRPAPAGSPHAPSRIAFVILGSGLSLAVAPHPASRRRSYGSVLTLKGFVREKLSSSYVCSFVVALMPALRA